MSEMFRLKMQDVLKGAITAVFSAVFVVLMTYVNTSDFDVFTANWQLIVTSMFQVGLSTFVGYVAKNFFTDSSGKFLGRV